MDNGSFDTNNNYCKSFEWKVPFEIITERNLSRETFYEENGIEVYFKDAERGCENPIVLTPDDYNDMSCIPMMFDILPRPSIDDAFNNEGFLLYGYKNIVSSSYFPVENIDSLRRMIKSLIYIRETIFEFYSDYCIRDLIQEGCSRKRVHDSSCGFIAPIFASILNQYLLHYTEHEPLQEDKLIMINMAKSYYKSISGYEGSPTGVGDICSGFTENGYFENGVYLVALYGREIYEDGGCDTYHHFIVYVQDEYCILIDSWACSKGARTEWLRIMSTEDMRRLMHFINTVDDINDFNRCLNIFFCIPHGNNGSDPKRSSYYQESFYLIDKLCSVGPIFLGHNTSAFWFNHAGRVALPTQEWKMTYGKHQERKDNPYENTFKKPYLSKKDKKRAANTSTMYRSTIQRDTMQRGTMQRGITRRGTTQRKAKHIGTITRRRTIKGKKIGQFGRLLTIHK